MAGRCFPSPQSSRGIVPWAVGAITLSGRWPLFLGTPTRPSERASGRFSSPGWLCWAKRIVRRPQLDSGRIDVRRLDSSSPTFTFPPAGRNQRAHSQHGPVEIRLADCSRDRFAQNRAGGPTSLVGCGSVEAAASWLPSAPGNPLTWKWLAATIARPRLEAAEIPRTCR